MVNGTVCLSRNKGRALGMRLCVTVSVCVCAEQLH